MPSVLAALVLIAFATSAAGIIDENGAPSRVGGLVKIQLEALPGQPFVYIVQVQDSAGRTAFLSWEQVQGDQVPSTD